MIVETEFNALEAVNLAIDMERSGHKLYLSAASHTADRNGGEMFTRLANDELAHLFWLITVRQTLLQTGKFGQIQETTSVAGRTVPEELACLKSGGRCVEITAETGELEALELGIEDEKESVSFYNRAAEKTNDSEGRSLFKRLAQWEVEHRQLLEAERDYLLSNGFYLGIAEFQLEGPEYLSWWRR